MKRIYTLSKTMAFLFSCMALIGTVISCADDYNTDPLTKNTILSSITIDEKYEVYTLVKGENYTLHFSTLPEDATNPGVSWVSGNEEVATVDANGKVTAVAVGTSVITAKPAVGYADGVSAAITISVVEELALTQSVEITNLPEELTMMETQSVQLKTKTVPEKPSFYLLSWKSSDEKVATVDENGRVLAVGEGKATITATTTDGTDLSHSVEVTVKPVIHVETFEMSSIHNKLAKGEISVLKYTVTPADATVSALVWTTSDATVASIEKRVLGEEEVFVILGGVNSGTATLTASITYADGSPGFEKSFEVSVVDGKINDDFLFTAGCFEGGDYGVLENGRLVRKIEKEANAKCEAQFRGTMTFYPSKYPIYAVKTFFEDSLDPAKTPTLLLNIWNYNPRISIGFYGGTAAGNAQNLYKVSMTRTSDGGYVTYADLSTPNIFKGANADFLTNGVLNDGITLDRCEHRFYDTYYTEAVTEPFALDWVKTFESLEAYKAYLIENEGVVFE